MNIHKLVGEDNDARTLLTLFHRSHEECFNISQENNIHIPIRRLFIQTDGVFNLHVSKAISNLRPAISNFKKPWERENMIFTRIEQQQIISELYESGGYAVGKIAKSDLEELKVSLDNTKSDGDSKRQFITKWELLKTHRIVQKLILDESLKEICDAYLGCKTILNMIVAWKTKPGLNTENLSSDAMMYHFDSDHNRFIKIFVYLDDVDEETGPHAYAPRTSVKYRRNLPNIFKQDGRLDDKLLKEYGIMTRKIYGEKGTIIFADTHNLHKGTPVKGAKSRYVLQLQFSDSLLGAPSPHHFPDIVEMNNDMLEL